MRKALQTLARDIDAWQLAPLAAFAVLPALAVRYKYLPVPTESAHLFPAFYYGDALSWWKAVLVVGIAGWMLALLPIRLGAGWRPRFRLFDGICLGAAVAILISTVASPYPVAAWTGSLGLHEGGLVFLAYLAAVWYGATAPAGERDIFFLLRCVGVVALVNAGMGLGQGLGWDWWSSAPGRWLLGGIPGDAGNIFAPFNMSFGTFYQPNHYGLFMGMATALGFAMLRIDRAGSWRILWVAVALAGLVAVVFSHSRAALLSCLIGGAAGFFVAVRQRRRGGEAEAPREKTAKTGTRPWLVAVIVAVMLAVGGGSLLRILVRQWERSLRDFSADRGESRLRSFALAGNAIVLGVGDHRLILRADVGGWRAFRDGEGGLGLSMRMSAAEPGGSTMTLDDYPELRLWNAPDGNVRLTFDDIALDFFLANGKLYAVDPQDGLHAALSPPARLETFGYDKLLSNRVYIWSRALPLVAEHPFFGSGPGSFSLIFPNQDLLGKQRHFFPEVEDKAHALWVSLPVQLGLVGTGFLCALFGLGLIGLLKSRSVLAPALIAALTAWAVGSLTNDSTVGVTPTVCVLLGVAFSVTSPEGMAHAGS